MACKTCGGSPVINTVTSDTPCSSCSQPKSKCSCTPACDTFCEEDHTIRVVNKRYAFTLRVVSSFVWPTLNQTVTLQVESVDRLSPGALLWNPNAGYLHVESFDIGTQSVIAKNLGESCNTYTGGETLPECTDFVVGPPTCIGSSPPVPGLPYLAADFISPNVAGCALASVTNILGLTIGDTVTVNGYQYRIGNIIDSGTIELCNDGDGAPTGTVIYWDDDNDGIPNIPILVIATENPCTRDPIIAGVILACDGGDVAKPLTGSIGGQIPVWNEITSRFELRNIIAPFTICTSLTAQLLVTVGHVGPYLVLVVDTSIFTVGDTVVIEGVSFIVNTISNSTDMFITPVMAPVTNHLYLVGTAVCLDVSEARADSDSLDATIAGPVSLVLPGDDQDIGPITHSITNTSLSKTMQVLFNHEFQIRDVIAAGPDQGKLIAALSQNINGAGFIDVRVATASIPAAGGDFSMLASFSEIMTIAPGVTKTMAIRGVLTLVATPPGSLGFNVLGFSLRSTYLAVAV